MTYQQSALIAFVEYGGALCQWCLPNTDASEVFGGSEIADAEEGVQRRALEAEGYTLDKQNGADRYTFVYDASTEFVDLFVGDYWYFGSGADVADRGRQVADVG